MIKQYYYIGRHNPAGNFFTASAIKNKITTQLNPPPAPKGSKPMNSLWQNVPKVAMFTYEQAKEFVIEQPGQDADHHIAGSFSRIGEHFQEFDHNLPRGAGPEFDKLHIALNFWDSWLDGRNHEWQYYPKIKHDDWPRLAKSIVADIAEDREIQDALIVEQFNFKK